MPSLSGNNFKSGSQLPSISNEDKKGSTAAANSLLKVSSGVSKAEENKGKKKQLIEESYGDDFEDDFGNEEEDEEEEDGDFDANELLNLTDYQNKRKQNQQPAATATGGNKQGQTVGKDGAIEISNDDFEDDGDAWGDDWGQPKQEKIDFAKVDYSTMNLNKLSTEQIAAHKKKMDEKFSKNQLKPGDQGFVYDKRIEFKKSEGGAAKQDTSWDEDEDNEEEEEEDVNDYFDDDFM